MSVNSPQRFSQPIHSDSHPLIAPNTIPSQHTRPTNLLSTQSARFSFKHAFTVGRSRKCDICIATSEETRTVSKFHIRIFPLQITNQSDDEIEFYPSQIHSIEENGETFRWILQDMSPLNGTSVNSVQLISGSTIEIHSNDKILLSRAVAGQAVLLRVFFSDEKHSRLFVDVYAPVHSEAGEENPQLPSENVANVEPLQAQVSAEQREEEGSRDSDQMCRKVDVYPSRKRVRSSLERYDGNEKHEDDERLLTCSICLEYFQRSATLGCSHTFCGYCLSNWFRTCLSCPQCRKPIQHVPVRNRALDDLVYRIVGDSESFQATAYKRLKEQDAHVYGVEQILRLSGKNMAFHSVWSHPWTSVERVMFHSFIEKQVGEQRESCFNRIGLTEESIDQVQFQDLLHCARNLNIDIQSISALSATQLATRIKIYMFYS